MYPHLTELQKLLPLPTQRRRLASLLQHRRLQERLTRRDHDNIQTTIWGLPVDGKG